MGKWEYEGAHAGEDHTRHEGLALTDTISNDPASNAGEDADATDDAQPGGSDLDVDTARREDFDEVRRENRAANTPKSPPTTRRNVVVIEKTDETCNAERPKVAASRSA